MNKSTFKPYKIFQMFIVLNVWVESSSPMTSLPPNWEEHLVLAGPFLLLCILEGFGTFRSRGKKIATSQGGEVSIYLLREKNQEERLFSGI